MHESSKHIIEKICTFVFILSNIDTTFTDEKLNIYLQYGYQQIPEVLKPYSIHWLNISKDDDTNSKCDIVFHTNSFRVNFIFARVYYNHDYIGNIVIGPYLLEEPHILMINDIIVENKLSISLRHMLTQYYSSLPLISSYKAQTIAELVGYIISDVQLFNSRSVNIATLSYNFTGSYHAHPNVVDKGTIESQESIEQRYDIEKQLLKAVENGNRKKTEELFSKNFPLFPNIPDRIPNDPLRSRKNLCLTFNTLLRKAAEKGGLHPLHIHNISEKFAIQIEQVSTLQEFSNLQHTMIFTYCDAVRALSFKNYGYIVRKALEFIHAHLDEDLSLEIISKTIHTSPYDLSRKFKKETNYTITQYINKQRIDEAIFIMENKTISITDLAHLVGFNDVNYFTKVFKKITGFTPSQYKKM